MEYICIYSTTKSVQENIKPDVEDLKINLYTTYDVSEHNCGFEIFIQ
jgi:hypothetical protein